MCKSISMRILSKWKLAVLYSLLALLVLSKSYGAETKLKNKTSDLWSVVKSYNLSPIAWSPNGDYIAFVAARDVDEDDLGLLRASIWVASISENGQVEKLRRLIVLTRKQGIPAALFWLDSNRIGWAASRATSFFFMQMSLVDNKLNRLTTQSFQGFKGTGDTGPWNAPDDVYYDSNSRSLLFSAALPPDNEVYVRILSLSTNKTQVLHVPLVKGAVNPKEWMISNVTLCGSLGNLTKPQFYLAASMIQPFVYEGGGFYLWRSDSYSLNQDEVLAYPPQWLAYPRTSSDGKLLAYLRGRKFDELVLRDLRSGSERVIVILRNLVPDTGCPFSWSPDGKMIAYADGAKIKIAQVN